MTTERAAIGRDECGSEIAIIMSPGETLDDVRENHPECRFTHIEVRLMRQPRRRESMTIKKPQEWWLKNEAGPNVRFTGWLLYSPRASDMASEPPSWAAIFGPPSLFRIMESGDLVIQYTPGTGVTVERIEATDVDLARAAIKNIVGAGHYGKKMLAAAFGDPETVEWK